MPSVLSETDKETVKRVVPKAANKIHAVAVARLYIAYPNKQQWKYTGLQGAAVLANDLIGNTYWIKLVDVSPANRGVLWDQEIYDPFHYNQDRTFFHSFELENCFAGLNFVDEKEAKQFKKKIDEREKNASKATKATLFQGVGHVAVSSTSTHEKHHGLFGSLLHGHRPSPVAQSSAPPAQSGFPPRETSVSPTRSGPKCGTSALDEVDPSWRGMLSELLAMGITEDQIEENADFIKAYIEQKQAKGGDGSLDKASNGDGHERRVKGPLPAPHSPFPLTVTKTISPQHTGNITTSRRGPPPAPPPTRRSRPDNHPISGLPRPHSPAAKSQQRTPSPSRTASRFRAPPPLADAGKFANSSAPAPSSRQRSASSNAVHGLDPPPRPPKTPIEELNDARPKFGVPPPFQGERISTAPPLAAHRPAIPPPPPRATRDLSSGDPVPPTNIIPPPLPPKTPNGPAPSSPPPLPSSPQVLGQRNMSPVISPQLVSSRSRHVTQSLHSSGVPPAPPPPPPATINSSHQSTFLSSNVPASSPPPPPPPLPIQRTPPPAPVPPDSGAPPAPRLSSSSGAPGGAPQALLSYEQSAVSIQSGPTPLKAIGGAEDLLASIRATGGLGSGRLKRVNSQEKRDRSAAVVPGATTTGSVGGGSQPPSVGGGGGLADALALALSARNKKVSASDDEDDNDDW